MGKQSVAIGNQLRASIATIVKTTVLEIDANLRASPDQGGTPVDTGNARARWVPNIATPARGGDHDAGVASVLGYKIGDGPVFESNDADYITALNNGHSKQAPALFVETAVDKALATMQQRYGSASISLDRFRDNVGAAGAENLASAYSPFGDD